MTEQEASSDEPQAKRQKLDDDFRNTETTLRNGVEIPKDSALLTTTEEVINDSASYLPSELLIKHNLAALPLTLQAHDSLPIRTQFVINTIPLLDNISTQILRLIGVGPYEETLAIITNEEPTPEGLVYRDLVELFEQVKRLYSEDDPFLQVGHVISNVELFDQSATNEIKNSLKDLEEKIDSTLRKANLATFLLATLGSIEVGFFFLDESFLDVFCPIDNTGWINNTLKSLNNGGSDGVVKFNDQLSHLNAGKLLKAPAALFLELKTQAYISSLESGDRPKNEILEDIFPSDLDQTLLMRRNNSTTLTPVEVDFINRCRSRKETLSNSPPENDEALSENYDWLIFLKELFNYVSKNIGYLVWGKRGRNSRLGALDIRPTQLSASPGPDIPNYGNLTKEEIQKRLEEHKRKELELKERDRLQLLSTEKPKRRTKNKTSSSKSAEQTPETSGPPSIRNMLRRPWTKEEDAALVDALKEVGPHWSRILDIYGAGGSKSEALKNRTQVQLKDKARNWKMSYLKNGTPVPEYLAKVTGVVERGDKEVLARKRQRKKIQEERERLLREKHEKLAQENNETSESQAAESTKPSETAEQKDTTESKEASESVEPKEKPELNTEKSGDSPSSETQSNETESKQGAETELQDKSEAEPQTESQAESQSEAQPDTQTENQADTAGSTTEDIPETNTETSIEQQAESQAESQAQAETPSEAN